MALFELYAVFGLLAAVFLGSAGVFQKRGLDELPEDMSPDWWFDGYTPQLGKIKEVIASLLNKYFLGGIVVALIGALFYITALSMPSSSLSIVQPLQAFGNFMALTLGVWWLKEDLSKLEYFGVILVIIGVIILNFVA